MKMRPIRKLFLNWTMQEKHMGLDPIWKLGTGHLFALLKSKRLKPTMTTHLDYQLPVRKQLRATSKRHADRVGQW